jgi:hypothetical protein
MTGAVLFYHSVFDEDIRAILERIGCQHFVEVPSAWAQDEGERRFGTHIYPGTDSIVLAFLEDDQAKILRTEVQTWKGDKVKAHTRLALFPVESFL